MTYPVLEILGELKQRLSENRIVILQAPPGAGKSTVLPLHLLNEPWLGSQKMIMLEPRRLAARSVAMRLAQMNGDDLGKSVGYRVRFESKVSDQTRIEVVTEGILTRMIQRDNALDGIGLLVFDEFHERSLQADLALALSLQVQQVLRDDLRILIMSATLDGERLSALLNNAPIVTSLGRQYPVTTQYIPADAHTPVTTHMAKAIRKALREETGDLLCFLPGAGEIVRAAELLEADQVDAVIYPLYGDLPFARQQEAILPRTDGRRKIVLATTIAETSLTIEGIGVVIDSGYARVPKFDPRSGLTRLETVRVTRDAAEQRAGRAGRLGPGVCYRLWTEAIQSNLVAHRVPEILDADLAPFVLELREWGVADVNSLTWITKPPPGSVQQATDLLHDLEALADDRITERGKEMLRLPTHPRIAHMLLKAQTGGKIELAAATDLAALLEERDPLTKQSGADITLRLEVLRKWRDGERVNAERNVLERIEKLASSWRRLFKIGEDNGVVADTLAGKLLMEAYPERIARQMEKDGERYKLRNGRIARLPDHDALAREPWVVAAHLDAGSGEGKIFMAAPVAVEDLMPMAHEQEAVRWDDGREMLTATMEKRIGNLVLATRPLPNVSDEVRARLWVEVIRGKGLKMLGWQESQYEWQARVMCLHHWRTDEGWPDVSDEALLRSLETWLTPFLNGVAKLGELQRLDWNAVLQTLIPWNIASRLDTLAPARIQVPSGSMIRVNYFTDGRPPVMEVRLQEVFGLLETPTVNEGRTRIIMHLLSPGYKPVQVTQDLRSFWTNTYAEVRKELRTRYPKHSWPEDPWTAQAVRGVKRKV